LYNYYPWKVEKLWWLNSIGVQKNVNSNAYFWTIEEAFRLKQWKPEDLTIQNRGANL
jgi:hypothetical protein